MAALFPVAPFPLLSVKKPSSKLEIKPPRKIGNYSHYNDTRYHTAPNYEGILASPCKRIFHMRQRRGVQNLGLPIRLRLLTPRRPPRLIMKGPRPPVRLRLTMPRPPLKIRLSANVVALNKAMWAQIAAKEQAAKPSPQDKAAPALAILTSAEEIAASARAIAASSYAEATENALTLAAKAIAASAEEVTASAQAIVASEDATALAAAETTIPAQTTLQPTFATLYPNAFFDTVMKIPILPLSLDHDTDSPKCYHIKNEDIKMER